MIKITKPLYDNIQKNIYTSMYHYIPENITQILPSAFFFDIETTGLSANKGMCYLIGVVYKKDNQWFYTQWFADQPNDEGKVIQSFFEFTKVYSYLIHFNGDSFDIPFITKRCQYMELPFSFEHLQSIDLFKRIRSLSHILMLENYKQKTIEQFLHIQRTDIYSGGDLIKIYQNYVMSPDDKALSLLLLHNHDDIAGLLQLLPILGYEALKCSVPTRNCSATINEARDFESNTIKELFITTTFAHTFPNTISLSKGPFYLRTTNQSIKIRVELLQKEMKYFYPDYQNYYYLPEEDCVVYKSLAAYVDKNHRTQAKADTCYVRKSGCFVPQPKPIVTPEFKENRKDFISYFELSNDFLNDQTLLQQYTASIFSFLQT